MREEIGYRIALIAIGVIQNGWAWWSMKSSRAAGTAFRRRTEGLPLALAISACFLAFAVGIVGYLVYPPSMAWSAIVLPTPVRWIGGVLLVLGSALIIWGARYLAGNYTLSVDTVEDHQLVTTGPYGLIRHPLYTGLLLESAGVGLWSGNAFIAAMGLITWTLLAVRTRLEETQLIARFGDDYRRYQRRVGMFLPRPSARRDDGASSD